MEILLLRIFKDFLWDLQGLFLTYQGFSRFRDVFQIFKFSLESFLGLLRFLCRLLRFQRVQKKIFETFEIVLRNFEILFCDTRIDIIKLLAISYGDFDYF